MKISICKQSIIRFTSDPRLSTSDAAPELVGGRITYFYPMNAVKIRTASSYTMFPFPSVCSHNVSHT